MTDLTALQLSDAISIPFARAKQWIDVINKTMNRFEINTPKSRAAFLAQIGHESDGLTRMAESLNYSPHRLLVMFSKYFSEDEVEQFAGRPEKIGNRIYANRFGNGNEASGDGFRYRGRGLPGITFKNNYEACGQALGIDLVKYPARLLEQEYAAKSAGWFWRDGVRLNLGSAAKVYLAKNYSGVCDLNVMAERNDVAGITLCWNGGYNGLEERLALNERASQVFA